jgi:hypothetical protein
MSSLSREKKEWLKLFEEYQGTNLSISRFAQLKKKPKPRCYYWFKKFNQSKNYPAFTRLMPQDCQPLLAAVDNESPAASLSISGDLKLSFNQTVSCEWLEQFIFSLGKRKI